MIMPPRIARLPRDARGYPTPWNVLTGTDGQPIFTVDNDEKTWQALREQLCPMCGERLGKWKWFAGGPLSAFSEHGWYIDLPGHRECIQFALRVCPYLALPKYLGRVDVVHPEHLPAEVDVLLDETLITARPEIFVAVAADKIEAQNRWPLAPYLRPVRPALAYEFWRHGELLTWSEAMPWLRQVLGAEFEIPEVAK